MTSQRMMLALAEASIDGTLPAFAWPGGHTIVYYTPDRDGCEPLCAECATMARREGLDWAPADWDTAEWIEERTICSHCCKMIVEEEE